MIITDSHIHTAFSSDSKTPMEDMVKRGIELGLTSLCFTDHMDYGFPEKYGLPFVFDPEPYCEMIMELKEKYKNQIKILMGVEIGLKVEETARIQSLLSQYSFDFVIGSLHLYHDLDPYQDDFWGSFPSTLDAVKTYLEEMLLMLNKLDGYQTLGHLDYVLRYQRNKLQHSLYEELPELVDEILLTIIRKKISLEVNSSGYLKLGAPNPSMDICKRYYELGGRLITIGSDAHKPENLAGSFDRISSELKKCGFTGYVNYESKKPHFIKL